MFEQAMPHNDVALRILAATDRLMALHGVQYLSTHKIAKEAGVSVGTIYLYFKDKEALLTQLVLSLFQRFHQAVGAGYDPSLPLFEQYRQLWWAEWQFMLANPNVVKNMHQYESLPQFQSLLRNCLNSDELVWNCFVKQGQQQQVIAPLSTEVLATMSIRVAWQVMYQQLLRDEPYPDSVLEEVIARTWKAISL